MIFLVRSLINFGGGERSWAGSGEWVQLANNCQDQEQLKFSFTNIARFSFTNIARFSFTNTAKYIFKAMSFVLRLSPQWKLRFSLGPAAQIG